MFAHHSVRLYSACLFRLSLLALACLTPTVWADQISKCLLPNGVVEYSNEPCRPGAKQLDKIVTAPPSASALEANRVAEQMRQNARESERARIETLTRERNEAQDALARERERTARAEAQAREEARTRAAEQERLAAIEREQAALREQRNAELLSLQQRQTEAIEELARNRAEQRTFFVPVPVPAPIPHPHPPRKLEPRDPDPGPRMAWPTYR